MVAIRFPPRVHSNFVQIGAAVTIVWIFVYSLFRYQSLPDSLTWRNEGPTHDTGASHQSSEILKSSQSIIQSAQYFVDYPLSPPYKDIFGELGVRAQVLRSSIEELERNKHTPHTDGEHFARELAANFTLEAVQSLFPYLSKSDSDSPHSSSPLLDLQNRVSAADDDAYGINESPPTKRRAGIVIPTGLKTLRFACHLIASLTRVHATKLPIQIVYAGDDDLPDEGREKLQEAAAEGVQIEFLNVLTVFDDKTLKLVEGGWANKPFAALASDFEQVILLDADTVFLQDPARLLEQKRFKETGVLLFHDRLLWKDGFKERQDWWHEQIKHPSKETSKSLVWTERYSEEGDSGIIVVDKSRLEVLIGLLHVGWQNSYAVREEWTYKATYGDKETWWLGFEMTGSKYAFSKHYGGMIGWLSSEPEPENKTEETSELLKPITARVCSFVIAHVDETDKLLWYNGGLLKNKLANPDEYEVPTHWMVDQEWHKGGKKDMSCMVGTNVNEVSEEEKDILARTIGVAKEVDKDLDLVPKVL